MWSGIGMLICFAILFTVPHITAEVVIIACIFPMTGFITDLKGK